MDIHRPAPPNRTRRNELLLRLSDDEAAALDRLSETRDATRSGVIRGLIIEAAAALPKKRTRAKR